MYPACTEGVQISGSVGFARFCTFAPVDMHGFVHTRCRGQDVDRAECRVGAGRTAVLDANALAANMQGRDLTQAANSGVVDEKKFFAHPGRSLLRFTTKIGIQG